MSFRHTIALFGLAAVASAQAPFIDPADDAKHLGPPGPLFWTAHQKVAGFRNYDRVVPARLVAAGGKPYPLPKGEAYIEGLSWESDGERWTLEEYFVRTNLAGLLVVRDGRVVYERYGLGNTPGTRWLSFSVAKSVVSMLVGAALQDGYIESLDERVTEYLPRLKGSSYGDATIRDLMRMASGVEWDETYDDPKSDVATAPWETLPLQRFLGKKPRAEPPGEKFNYNTAETNLVGTLLRAAIGNNLSTYLSEKIWRPFGMEADAKWTLTEAGGGEFGGCCLNATLRDYTRLGLFALADGKLPDGTRVLPEGWMRESTAPSPAYDGYGYLWWLTSGEAYRASGIFGQRIFIDPESDVVIAQHGAREAASDDRDWKLQAAMEAAVVRRLSR